MTHDLCIHHIVDVFYQQTVRWERTQPRTRGYDAVVLFCEGEIEYYFEEKVLTARAGDLLLLPGNLPYSGKKKSRSAAFYVLDFQCTSPTAFAAFGAPAVITLSQYEEVLSQFHNALLTWQRQSIDSSLHLKAFAYSLLCNIFREETRKERTTATENILAYIAENLHDSAMSVTSLCQHFYISESQLRRNLYKATGLNPNQYLLVLRLNRAKSELLCTEKTVQQIATDCGFASPYYFTRRFTAHFGQPPSVWRKTHMSI